MQNIKTSAAGHILCWCASQWFARMIPAARPAVLYTLTLTLLYQTLVHLCSLLGHHKHTQTETEWVAITCSRENRDCVHEGGL